MTLANMKIGKRLALLMGSVVMLIVCVAGLGIWSLHSVGKAADEAQVEMENMLLADKISGATGSLTVILGNSVIRGSLTSRRSWVPYPAPRFLRRCLGADHEPDHER